jgi:hypothetical protein
MPSNGRILQFPDLQTITHARRHQKDPLGPRQQAACQHGRSRNGGRNSRRGNLMGTSDADELRHLAKLANARKAAVAQRLLDEKEAAAALKRDKARFLQAQKAETERLAKQREQARVELEAKVTQQIHDRPFTVNRPLSSFGGHLWGVARRPLWPLQAKPVSLFWRSTNRLSWRSPTLPQREMKFLTDHLD